MTGKRGLRIFQVNGKPDHQRTGQQGEALAAQYLRDKGYQIITTNWHCPQGELDIVAQYQNMLIFVEVRTRHAMNSETAFASILPGKRDRIIRAIYSYLEQYPAESELNWRLDAIGIGLRRGIAPVIEHVEDAFDW